MKQATFITGPYISCQRLWKWQPLFSTILYKLLVGVVVAIRSVYVPPNAKESMANRQEVSRAALYCLIVNSAGNLQIVL